MRHVVGHQFIGVLGSCVVISGRPFHGADANQRLDNATLRKLAEPLFVEARLDAFGRVARVELLHEHVAGSAIG